MFLIFRPELQDAPLPDEVNLTDAEHKHIRARRMKDGDTLHVGDGRSRRWSGILSQNPDRITHINPVAEIREEPTRELFIAPPSGKRWDWLLQKATETGVTRITPVIFRHSERTDISLDRSAKILSEAASQSERFFLPQISNSIALPELIQKNITSQSNWILLNHGDHPSLIRLNPGNEPVFLIIGPEGGLTENETAEMANAGTQIYKIGSHILRIETAAIAGLSILLAAAEE